MTFSLLFTFLFVVFNLIDVPLLSTLLGPSNIFNCDYSYSILCNIISYSITWTNMVSNLLQLHLFIILVLIRDGLGYYITLHGVYYIFININSRFFR